MNLSAYIEKEYKTNQLSKELIDELKKISEDKEFISGVLLDVENDKDKLTLLEYIRKGEDVNYSQVILNSLWLYQQREQENNWYSQKKTVFKLPWSKMRKQIDVKLKITRRWLYMKVRYIAFDCTDLTKGNIYECLGQEYDC